MQDKAYEKQRRFQTPGQGQAGRHAERVEHVHGAGQSVEDNDLEHPVHAGHHRQGQAGQKRVEEAQNMWNTHNLGGFSVFVIFADFFVHRNCEFSS